jgi:hypothetical protein
MGDNNLHDCCTHSMVGRDEIIPGMAELLQYIRDQDQKIKNLENNEKVRDGLHSGALEKVKNLEINEKVREVALQIVKDENEVNKKNMFRCMEENVKLTKEKITLKKRLEKAEGEVEEWEDRFEGRDADELLCRLEDLEDTETKYEKLKEMTTTFAQQAAELRLS